MAESSTPNSAETTEGDVAEQETVVSTPTKPASNPNKVDILLKATADAPLMVKKKWSVDRDKKLIWVIEFVRRYLKLTAADSLFIYVNQSFSPAPDVMVGSLFDCFASDKKLILHYCTSQAWG